MLKSPRWARGGYRGKQQVRSARCRICVGRFVARVENRHRAGSRTEETTVKHQLTAGLPAGQVRRNS